MRRSTLSLALLAISLAPLCASAQQSAGPKAAVVTREAFQQLRWLEGKWRGSGGAYPEFFERYRFLDDSTIVMENFPDATFKTPSGRHLYELRNRQLVARGSSESVADQLDKTSVTFHSTSGAPNSYSWERQSPDAWVAVLTAPATSSRPAQVVTYQMKRVK